ncbi:12841_t:CDS:2 [Racocetra fulgida]|uniref:12841_t:CDS:1 n=1 Tax=Racocetra fulgida TaxID=60492 RepID=A0A9N9F8I6_9GLOM|nr:12841_t:CDS:2 [Racocetra fulgida]
MLQTARAKKCAYITKELDYENLDDYIWLDKDIDKKASDYFAVLLIAKLKKTAQNTQSITACFASTLIHSKVASVLTSTCKSSTELFVSIEIKPMEVKLIELMEAEQIEMKLTEVGSMDVELAELEIDKKTKMRLAIEKLDRILKKNNN